MKTIKVTYTETIEVTNEVEVSVSDVLAKKLLAGKNPFEVEDTLHDLMTNTAAYENHTEVVGREFTFEEK